MDFLRGGLHTTAVPCDRLERKVTGFDDHMCLHLQAVFNRTYEAGPYAREIDYRQDAIEPPVEERDAAFVQAKRESTPERPAV
jgi:hypothetical protein